MIHRLSPALSYPHSEECGCVASIPTTGIFFDFVILRTYAVEPFGVTKTRFCLRQHGTLRSYVCLFCALRAQKRQTRKGDPMSKLEQGETVTFQYRLNAS